MIVFHVKNLLQGQGIDSLLKNEFASGGVGDLSPFETWPEIWVDDEQFAEAQRFIDLQSLQEVSGSEWICPDCGELNDGNFMICWNCNHANPEARIKQA